MSKNDQSKGMNKEGKMLRNYFIFEQSLSFYVTGILLLFLMVLMSADVFARWALGTSIVGVFEVVEASMVIVTFASLAGIQKQRGHVNVNLLMEKLPQRIKLPIEIIGLVFILVVFISTLYPLVNYVIQLARFHEATEFLKLPLWFIALFMPLGVIMLCIRLLIQIVTECKKFFGNVNNI